MEELLSLKWNNHRSSFIYCLSNLRTKHKYTDVTLACDGQFYKAHKIVLSACSDYFSNIFESTDCKNPVVVLKDIQSTDLESLLDYMYLGEVNVKQSELGSLVKAAECLQLKGLAAPDDATSSTTRQHQDSNDDLAPPRKKAKYTNNVPSEEMKSDVPNKTSIISLPTENKLSQPLVENDNLKYLQENFKVEDGEVSGFKENVNSNDNILKRNHSIEDSFSNIQMHSLWDSNEDQNFLKADSISERSFSFNAFECFPQNELDNSLNFCLNKDGLMERSHVCTCCGKSFPTKSTLIRHLRIHTGEKPFACPHCPFRGNQKAYVVTHMMSRHGDYSKTPLQDKPN